MAMSDHQGKENNRVGIHIPFPGCFPKFQILLTQKISSGLPTSKTPKGLQWNTLPNIHQVHLKHMETVHLQPSSSSPGLV